MSVLSVSSVGLLGAVAACLECSSPPPSTRCLLRLSGAETLPRRLRVDRNPGMKNQNKNDCSVLFPSFCICALGSLGFFGGHFVVGALCQQPRRRRRQLVQLLGLC